MTTAAEPLDEIQWRSAGWAAQNGGIHTNTIHPYFAQSPFFDRTSNNATLLTQANYNPSMASIVSTRDNFESHLRSMSGIEYVVAYAPIEPTAAGGIGGGEQTWVIRKQNRRKRAAGAGGRGQDDEVIELATYFVVGENVYMAPTVMSVISTRLLSTLNNLTTYLSTAAAQPLYTPSLGHIYTLPTPKPPNPTTSSTTTTNSQTHLPLSQSAQSTQGSKEGTPLPDTLRPSQPQSQPPDKLPTSSSSSSTPPSTSTALLAASLRLALRHPTSTLDNPPLNGEPGSFILASSTINPAQQPGNPAAHPSNAAKSTTLNTTSSAPTPMPRLSSTSPPSPQLPTKGSKGEKSPIAGEAGAGKRRKKSKVAGGGDGIGARRSPSEGVASPVS
ncbi:MAG: Mediator of RNA polymerase II transcription subunit 6 [Caeruleum heppii]|nr:MAG: Mediator of RNA polymerase II transcription subunit 6 [Caeruleum heppii]